MTIVRAVTDQLYEVPIIAAAKHYPVQARSTSGLRAGSTAPHSKSLLCINKAATPSNVHPIQAPDLLSSKEDIISVMASVISCARQSSSFAQRWPPVFLAPTLSSMTRTSAPFSTSSPMSQRRSRRRDNNPDRGVSALRRTGLKYRVEMSSQPLPQPVLDPNKRSKVTVDEDHGLWGFFRNDKKALSTPEETDAFGRPWVVEELRHKSWEDLHSLWWVCCRERNILATQEYERKRLKAGYGDAENMERDRAVRQTQKAIKHALTERYYAFEEARRVAVTDQEVDLDAEPGTHAYTPIYSDESLMEDEYPVKRTAGAPESTA